MNAKKCKELRRVARNIIAYIGKPLNPAAAYKAKTHTRTIVTPVFDSNGKITGLDDLKRDSIQILLSRYSVRGEYQALKRAEKRL